ncbi:hypothetical protein [Catenulispora sp. GP43]|uniref:hypothetical protein n=1 Tax=Catenulispora sp. GP43 TaxID=3156263 RepID=UPI003518B36B
MRADLLGEPIAGCAEALAVVDGFDRVLAGGLLRPRAGADAALAALADAVGGTPLGSLVAEAAEKAAAGAAGEDHLVALAGARVAILGSVHDALVARLDEVTGRTRGAWPDGGEVAQQPANLLAAARSWLADVARAGWHGMDHELVAGAAPVVSVMLPDTGLRRLATLLDGFAAELAASCPGATLERVPVRRWADLWSRAMLLTQPGAAAGSRITTGGGATGASTNGGSVNGASAAGTSVSGASGADVAAAAGASSTAATVTGRLLPLGVDLNEHATAVQAQIHAVLEPADGGAPRLVRASVAAPKPDTVVGMGVWQLLRPHMSLIAAFSEGRAMDLVDMPITAEGDLRWSDDKARRSEPADPFAAARLVLPTATAAFTAPLARHPARIAELVFLEGYKVADGVLELAGGRLVVDTDRIPSASPLTPEMVWASTSCIGLVRWDAGAFTLQPLAVEATVKKKATAVHAGAWAGGTADKEGVQAEKAAAEAVTVLRERAGRLLRK